MASKKKISILPKLGYKKPVKNAKKAVTDLAKIRNKERYALNRLKSQFTATKKKGEADRLRKAIKAQEKALTSYNATVKDARKASGVINSLKSQTKGLRLKNAAITRKINGLKGAKNADARAKLNKLFHRNANAIHDKERLINEQLYQVNKKLGFKPTDIVGTIKLSRRQLEKEHADDFPEDYFADFEPLSQSGAEIPEGELTEAEAFEEEETEDEDGYFETLSDVFWTVWKDFDTNELPGIDRYETVIFVFGGHTSKFQGTSISLLSMKAAEMWRYCQAMGGSNTYVVKYQNADRTKLKYVVVENGN